MHVANIEQWKPYSSKTPLPVYRAYFGEDHVTSSPVQYQDSLGSTLRLQLFTGTNFCEF